MTSASSEQQKESIRVWVSDAMSHDVLVDTSMTIAEVSQEIHQTWGIRADHQMWRVLPRELVAAELNRPQKGLAANAPGPAAEGDTANEDDDANKANEAKEADTADTANAADKDHTASDDKGDKADTDDTGYKGNTASDGKGGKASDKASNKASDKASTASAAMPPRAPPPPTTPPTRLPCPLCSPCPLCLSDCKIAGRPWLPRKAITGSDKASDGKGGNATTGSDKASDKASDKDSVDKADAPPRKVSRFAGSFAATLMQLRPADFDKPFCSAEASHREAL